ncbi:MAG: hypothetical protein E3J88_02505 [Anaerolineales bacterium]|nr:MAG: hypothetical protein E3J88_02505 [Anaerolineales bacterium]
MSESRLLAILTITAVIITACSPVSGGDPNESVAATPGQGQPTQGGGEPTTGDMVHGPVFIDDVQLLILESYPIQVMLNISGELPTPCHIFQADVSEPDEDNEIQVEVYSVVAEGEVCIEVIQPFSENVSIPMAGKPDGVYTVWVNGEKVGEFSYPG